MSTITLNEAAELAWLEADLLDQHDYQPWLNLWHPEGLYVIPVEFDATDFANTLNVAYDNADMRRMRVARLSGRQSMSVNAGARTMRTVSRFRLLETADDRCVLRGAQILIEHREAGERIFPATVEYTIVRSGGELKLMQKVVRMLRGGDALTGISYLP